MNSENLNKEAKEFVFLNEKDNNKKETDKEQKNDQKNSEEADQEVSEPPKAQTLSELTTKMLDKGEIEESNPKESKPTESEKLKALRAKMEKAKSLFSKLKIQTDKSAKKGKKLKLPSINLLETSVKKFKKRALENVIKKKRVPFVARGSPILQKEETQKNEKKTDDLNQETKPQMEGKGEKDEAVEVFMSNHQRTLEKAKEEKDKKVVIESVVNGDDSRDIHDINSDYLIIDLANIRKLGFWFTQLMNFGLQDDILDKAGPLFTSEVENELAEAGFRTFVIMTRSKFRIFLRDGSNALELQFSCYIRLIQEVIVETENSRIATIILKNGKIFSLL